MAGRQGAERGLEWWMLGLRQVVVLSPGHSRFGGPTRGCRGRPPTRKKGVPAFLCGSAVGACRLKVRGAPLARRGAPQYPRRDHRGKWGVGGTSSVGNRRESGFGVVAAPPARQPVEVPEVRRSSPTGRASVDSRRDSFTRLRQLIDTGRRCAHDARRVSGRLVQEARSPRVPGFASRRLRASAHRP